MLTLKFLKPVLFHFLIAALLAVACVKAVQTVTSTGNTQTVQASMRLSRANRSARYWIAMHESGGRWHARNGSCYGRYQLQISYLHGNYSHRNQTDVANNYAFSRYGSWVGAKRFWLRHHWY